MDQKHMALASFTMAGVGDASAKTRPQAGRWRNLSPDQDVAPPRVFMASSRPQVLVKEGERYPTLMTKVCGFSEVWGLGDFL